MSENPVEDEFDYKFKLLMNEMDHLQSGIGSYDTIMFTIKGWAITAFSAFVFLNGIRQ